MRIIFRNRFVFGINPYEGHFIDASKLTISDSCISDFIPCKIVRVPSVTLFHPSLKKGNELDCGSESINHIHRQIFEPHRSAWSGVNGRKGVENFIDYDHGKVCVYDPGSNELLESHDYYGYAQKLAKIGFENRFMTTDEFKTADKE